MACSKDYSPPFTHVNPVFSKYVQLYNTIKTEETGQSGGYYPMEFGDVPSPETMGLANTNGQNCWIIINEKYWNFISENSKKELIFHELLHCDYIGWYHIDGTIMDEYHTRSETPEDDLRFIFNNY